MEFTIKELWVYPIKSCKGMQVSSLSLDEKGFKYDRRFMLTDENYQFLTQRDHHSMALIAPVLTAEYLKINAPGMRELILPLSFDETNIVNVKIWKDDTFAAKVGDAADLWFSEYFGFKTHLLYMPDKAERIVDPRYAKTRATTTFTDDYPILLISQSSLDDLNARLEQPLPMNRFRPNIVVSGTSAFAEDGWSKIKIGEIEFDVVKPSARCVMITIEQETGTGGAKEPLKTLSTYRSKDNKILFGQYLIHLRQDNVSIGDRLEVIS
ncbi:MAG TPA: MOSC N-terminal beta barrel domain-containing protein [Cytophagaceae bacterium]|jgi:hypothetical protein